MVLFHFFELLKSLSIWNITWKLTLTYLLRFCEKTLKSGHYFYEHDLLAKGTCLTTTAVFLIIRFSLGLYNSTLKWYHFIFLELLKSLSMWKITWKLTLNYLLRFCEKTLKYGHHFYEHDLLAKGTCLTTTAVFLRIRFSLGLYNSTLKWYYFIFLELLKSLSMLNITWKLTLTYLLRFCEKTA